MSFRIYKIRSDILLRTTYDSHGVRYLATDPVSSAYFQITFLQYEILRFYQAAPATAQEGVRFLEERHDLEVDEANIIAFLEGMRKKLLIEPDSHLPMTGFQLAKISSNVRLQLTSLVRKTWRKQRPSDEDREVVSQIFLCLRTWNIHGAYALIFKETRKDPENILFLGIYRILRSTFITEMFDKKEQAKHQVLVDVVTEINPESFLNKLKSWTWPFYTTIGASILILGFLSALSIFFQHREYWVYGWIHLSIFVSKHFLLGWFIGLFSMWFHELGHALTCVQFGGKVRRIGFLFMLGVIPGMFADITDTYSMPRWRRFLCEAGGPFFNLFLWVVFLHVWLWTEPGTAINIIATLFCIGNGLASFMNFLPGYKSDGYFILADLTGIENLFFRSFSYCHQKAKSWFFTSSEPLPVVSRREAFWFWFFVLTIMFRNILGLLISIIVTISIWRELAGVIQVIFFMTLIRLVLKLPFLVRKLRDKLASLPSTITNLLHNSHGPIRIPKPILILGVFVLLSLVPVYHTVRSAAEIEPAEIRIVRAPVEGLVSAVFVSEGDIVKPGQLLARMKNHQLEHSYEREQWEFIKLSEEFTEFVNGLSPEEQSLYLRQLDVGRALVEKQELQMERAKKANQERVISLDDLQDRYRKYQQERKKFEVLLAEVRAKMSRIDILSLAAKKKNLELQLMTLQELKQQLARKEIFSSSRGIVLTAQPREKIGAYFKEGDELLTIASPENFVKIGLKEADLVRIKKGDSLYFTNTALGGEKLEGEVLEIFPTTETLKSEPNRRLTRFPSTSRGHVRGSINTASTHALLPGMTGRVKIDIGWKPLYHLLFWKALNIYRVNFWSLT